MTEKRQKKPLFCLGNYHNESAWSVLLMSPPFVCGEVRRDGRGWRSFFARHSTNLIPNPSNILFKMDEISRREPRLW